MQIAISNIDLTFQLHLRWQHLNDFLATTWPFFCNFRVLMLTHIERNVSMICKIRFKDFNRVDIFYNSLCPYNKIISYIFRFDVRWSILGLRFDIFTVSYNYHVWDKRSNFLKMFQFTWACKTLSSSGEGWWRLVILPDGGPLFFL